MRLLLLLFRLIFSSLALKIYFLAVVAAFCWVSHRKVMAYLCTIEEFMVDPASMEFHGLPSWVDDRIRTEIRNSFPYRRRFSIFSADIEERLKEAYIGNPWVAGIKNFRRELPNKIHFSFLLRRPAVSVERNGIYYIVGEDGVLLPRTYETPPAFKRRLHVVSGVQSNPPEFGRPWSDEGLRAGISVASALERHSVRNLVEITVIDVSNVNGRIDPRMSEIVLWSGRGAPILWGRAPCTRMYGELPVEHKIRNLKTILLFSPDLRGIEYAKIQFDRPYVRLRGCGT